MSSRECPPKLDRTGKMAHYVAATVGGKKRCLKAGGATAKRVLGAAGCPPDKVFLMSGGKMRCVRAGGATAKAALGAKGCRAGQVLAEGRKTGVMPAKMGGHRYDKIVRMCLTPATAQRRGWRIVSR